MDAPQKGDALVNTGWGLVALSGVLFAASLSNKHTRDPSIEALLQSPSIRDFLSSIAILAGLNMFAVLAAIMGAYALKIHANHKGKRLLWGCLLVFAVSSGRQFLPSDTAVGSIEAKQPDCEFAVTFPHRFKTRTASYLHYKSAVYQSADQNTPMLKAEFTPLAVNDPIHTNFDNGLRQYAYSANIVNPEFTVETTAYGKKGTYAGTKKAGGYDFRMYGIVVLGKSSMLHCMVLEPLNEFPSAQAVSFMSSIRPVN